jgi:hypothetical protein
MDAQWGIDEDFRVRHAGYRSGHPGGGHSGPLMAEMDKPAYWGRPFFQAARFGESHDMVSGKDSLGSRIAARPPFGQGFRGDANYQTVATGNRSVAFACGSGERLFAVVTCGTPNQLSFCAKSAIQLACPAAAVRSGGSGRRLSGTQLPPLAP